MADKIDMSLDDIIKSKKTSQKRTGPARSVPRQNRVTGNVGPVRTFSRPLRSRPNPYARPGKVSDKWQHDMFDGNTKNAKLMVGNLHYRVSDKDLMELFSEFGHIKKASIHYDKSGRSLGNAEVVFATRISAVKARDKYNDVLLDGRKMKITLVGDSQQQQIRQTPQVAQRGQKFGNQAKTGFGGVRRNQTQNRPKTAAGPKRQKQAAPTLEELDADLDAYVNKS